MDATTKSIVEFALDTTYESLSSAAVHECKRRLIDTFGCAIAGYEDALGASVRELAMGYSGTLTANIWGSRLRSTAEMAAFANGVMLRVLDYSDTYLALGGAHPSDIIAGIVAAADCSHASGRALVAAIVTGYEIYCRFMQVVDASAKGFDQPVPGVLATAAAAGVLMGLSGAQLGHAISLALTPNMALRQTRHGELSSWKGCAGANASRNAVFAVILARHGVEGPSAVFEGRQGVWSVLGKFEWPGKSVLKSTQMIASTHMKSLPVCYHDQSAALCARELHQRLKGQEISEIRCDSYHAAVEMTAGDPAHWAPTTPETADHSMPFIVATVLAHGKVTRDSFSPARLADPKIGRLMRLVKVTEDPELTAMWPNAAPTRMTVQTVSGESHSVEVRYPKGHLLDPLSDDEVNAKFIELIGRRGEAGNGKAALEALWDIDSVLDVAAEMPGLLPA